MTNEQMYLSIEVPILVNIIFNGMLIGVMWASLGRRINRLEDRVDLLTGKVVELIAKLDK